MLYYTHDTNQTKTRRQIYKKTLAKCIHNQSPVQEPTPSILLLHRETKERQHPFPYIQFYENTLARSEKGLE
jgi:hypothetical protein